MTRRASERALSAALQGPLADRGFEEVGALDFFRPNDLGGYTLRFGTRLDQERRVRVSGTVGIVFLSLNRIVGLGDEVDERFPTVMMPIHLLHPDRSYREWTMAVPSDAPAVASEIVQEVDAFALPFLTAFGQIDAVKGALQSPHPRDWFMLNPEQRLVVLAAIEQLAGQPDQAKELLRQGLLERTDELPKCRVALERALARLDRP